ncbi:MAG: InlB B-repeat-containing protein, partial [Clostridia bacterium]|nr:InlB B-repeat-containing protein [Clostridia bacterium]
MAKKILTCFLIVTSIILCCFCIGTSQIADAYAETGDQSFVDTMPPKRQDLPTAYCLRDEYIIFSQNQDNTGFCWNFAATMCASTAIMTATGEYYDFSELWAGISAYQTTTYSKVGAGGGHSTHYNATQNGGFMLETDLPYSNAFIVSNENATDFYNFYNKYSNTNLSKSLINDSSTSFNRGDVEKMKQHIYNYGSVSMAFNFKKSWISDNGVYYKQPNEPKTTGTHAISVIGWDDEYQQEIHLEGRDQPVLFKGAWLVLNSYTENQGTDGVLRIFYNDTNILYANGYKFEWDTSGDFYFYDKIEKGGEYITNAKGKYYGDYTPENGETLQKNIFYDDVNLEYSYMASTDTVVTDVDVYLSNLNVSNSFDITIDNEEQKFTIAKENADYGQYKVLVTYSNGTQTDCYLNNFFVTYGLVGEEIEFDYANNTLAYNTGRELEYFSFNPATKNYVIYTNEKSGSVSFLQTKQSIYSDQNMSLPTISYNITEGNDYTYTHSKKSSSGYNLNYNFTFEYCEDTSLQPVNVFYDLAGGVNHSKNYAKELASPTSDLALYAPTREGYTFAGWYLDYGNGSKKVEQIDGIYYIDWDDIHHMGENPTLFASSHYKNYYANSNTVFVYARWKEIAYYNVDLTINGNGSCQLGNHITVSSNETLKYLFTPNRDSCLYEVKINGVAVGYDKLLNISEKGLTLSNIQQDTSIEATFKEGRLILINYGENIKTAYITITHNNESINLYNGDILPLVQSVGKPLFTPTNTRVFTLTVELEECEDGYTYVFDDILSYTAQGNGVYSRQLMMSISNIASINIGDATKIATVPVEVSYDANSNIVEHYLSADPMGVSKYQSGHSFEGGQIIHLFIKVPADTYEYDYQVPDGFSSFSRNMAGYAWYKKSFVVDPLDAYLGTFEVDTKLKSYYISWLNWDDTLIYEELYYVHEMPEYDYECYKTPTKPDDGIYTYTFVGWDAEIGEVVKTTTYTAVFEESIKTFDVNVDCGENGTCDITTAEVEINSNLTVNITPAENFEIDSILVNGTAVDVTTTLTLENITENIEVVITFKAIQTVPPVDNPSELPTDTPDTPQEPPCQLPEEPTIECPPEDNTVTWIVVG